MLRKDFIATAASSAATIALTTRSRVETEKVKSDKIQWESSTASGLGGIAKLIAEGTPNPLA